jgi:hypothetical protein
LNLRQLLDLSGSAQTDLPSQENNLLHQAGFTPEFESDDGGLVGFEPRRDSALFGFGFADQCPALGASP